jgi:hypothetical protein
MEAYRKKFFFRATKAKTKAVTRGISNTKSNLLTAMFADMHITDKIMNTTADAHKGRFIVSPFVI